MQRKGPNLHRARQRRMTFSMQIRRSSFKFATTPHSGSSQTTSKSHKLRMRLTIRADGLMLTVIWEFPLSFPLINGLGQAWTCSGPRKANTRRGTCVHMSSAEVDGQ